MTTFVLTRYRRIDREARTFAKYKSEITVLLTTVLCGNVALACTRVGRGYEETAISIPVNISIRTDDYAFSYTRYTRDRVPAVVSQQQQPPRCRGPDKVIGFSAFLPRGSESAVDGPPPFRLRRTYKSSGRVYFF